MPLTGNNAITPQTPKNFQCKFIQGTDGAGTYKAAYTADTNGTSINGMTVVNTDTVAHNLTIAIVNTNGTFVLNTVSLTASAGNNGTTAPIAAQSVVNWPGRVVDGNGNPSFFLASGDTLEMQYGTSLAVASSGIYVSGDAQAW